MRAASQVGGAASAANCAPAKEEVLRYEVQVVVITKAADRGGLAGAIDAENLKELIMNVVVTAGTMLS